MKTYRFSDVWVSFYFVFFFGNSVRPSTVISKICFLKVCCINKVYSRLKTKDPTTSMHSLLHKKSKSTTYTHGHF